MKHDNHGQVYFAESEVIDLLYKNPDLDLSLFKIEDPDMYNRSSKKYHGEIAEVAKYEPNDSPLEEFDQLCQSTWFMPQEYRDLDIAKWILDQCSTQEQLQRCGEELLMFQERDLIDLLRYLKYFVDTARKNGIVWGVGRGSSVSSYVLYKLGVHKIDSMYYDLDVKEFLR